MIKLRPVQARDSLDASMLLDLDDSTCRDSDVLLSDSPPTSIGTESTSPKRERSTFVWLDVFRKVCCDPTWNALCGGSQEARCEARMLAQYSMSWRCHADAPRPDSVLHNRWVDRRWFLRSIFHHPPSNTPVRIMYGPKPSPSILRSTKNNHKIFQGVTAPNVRLTKER